MCLFVCVIWCLGGSPYRDTAVPPRVYMMNPTITRSSCSSWYCTYFVPVPPCGSLICFQFPTVILSASSLRNRFQHVFVGFILFYRQQQYILTKGSSRRNRLSHLLFLLFSYRYTTAAHSSAFVTPVLLLGGTTAVVTRSSQ